MIDFLLLPMILVVFSFLLILLATNPSWVDKLSLSLIVVCLFLTFCYVLANFFTGSGITEAVFDHIPLAFSWAAIRPYWEVFASALLAFVLVVLTLFYSVFIFKPFKFYLRATPVFRRVSAGAAIFLAFSSIYLHPAYSEIGAITHDKYLLRGNDILTGDVAVVEANIGGVVQKKALSICMQRVWIMFFLMKTSFPG